MILLPDPGYQPIRDPFLILRISGKIPGEQSLLVASRHIRNGSVAATARRPQYEPSASGVPMKYSNAPAYIG